MVPYAKISPKMVSPRAMAEKTEEEEEEEEEVLRRGNAMSNKWVPCSL